MGTVYIVEQGAEVQCDGERLVVRKKEDVLQTVPIARIEDMLIIGNVGLSTPAIKRLLDAQIDVTFLTVHGRYHGRLIGRTSPHIVLRRAQYRCADDPVWSLAQAQRCVIGKLRNCRALLYRFARNRTDAPDLVGETAHALDGWIERATRTTRIASLLGVEGSATALYFRGLRALFDPTWAFVERNRRPPTDPVNVLLSLGYTLLSHKVLGAVESVGFDPFQGFLHQLDYNRPSLALDMMEEFRPLLIDSLILRCCSEDRITRDDFVTTSDGAHPIVLTDDGKRRFIAAFEERMRTLVTHPEGADSGPGKTTYLRCLELQARRLARSIRGGAAYQPFTSR